MALVAQNGFDDLLAAVKRVPHWRVIIRPEVFEEGRIPSLADCQQIVESSKVSLGGMGYPRLYHHEKLSRGNDWVGYRFQLPGVLEVWRFYQSGQFVQRFSLRESEMDDVAVERERNRVYTPEDFTPMGFMDWMLTLYTVTQVFEFAARLAEKGVFDDALRITIEMIGVKDRVLCLLGGVLQMDRFYAAGEDRLAGEWACGTEDILANSAALARVATAHFFERFGWDVSPDWLANQQKKFFGHTT